MSTTLTFIVHIREQVLNNLHRRVTGDIVKGDKIERLRSVLSEVKDEQINVGQLVGLIAATVQRKVLANVCQVVCTALLNVQVKLSLKGQLLNVGRIDESLVRVENLIEGFNL